jgi:hypothetical protein
METKVSIFHSQIKFMCIDTEQFAQFEQPLRLGRRQRQDPIGVLVHFFEDYRLHECRGYLRNMVEVCLTTDNAEFGEAEQRAWLLQQYKDLEALVEAAWLIVRSKKGRSGKKN